MIKKWKQMLASILIIASIASLAACGGSPSDPIKESNNPSASAQHSVQPTDEDEAPMETEQEQEIKQETIEDKAKNAMATLEVWDGSIAESFDGGDGSSENPYQIANGEQLAKLAVDTQSGVDFSGKHFILTSDIVLNDISQWDFTSQDNSSLSMGWNSWLPIGGTNMPFEGTFDGYNHIIWGGYDSWVSASPSAATGLFGTLDGTISNITVACSVLRPASESVGTIVGKIDEGFVDNCHALQVEIKPINATSIGGICGEFSNNSGIGTINCSFEGTIVCKKTANKSIKVGGIVGRGMAYENAGYINGCYSNLNLSILAVIVTSISPEGGYYSSLVYAGGICGIGDIVDNCYSINNIAVIDVQTAEDVEGTLAVSIGGVVGLCNTSITNCGSSGSSKYSGDIEDIYVGGIAGILGTNVLPESGRVNRYHADVSFCYSNVAIDIDTNFGTLNIGGITGCAGGEVTVTNCYYNKECSDKAVAHTVPRSAVFTDQIKGLSNDELCESSNYYNWDFDFTWMINEGLNKGLPMLRSLIEYY